MSEEEELRRLISAITAYAVPKHIVLFGSRAKGLARSESDFDLASSMSIFPSATLKSCRICTYRFSIYPDTR